MKLRDYQTELSIQGCSILKEHKIVYYALETRVGKTLIGLNTAKLYCAKSVLFVTKKKAIKSIEGDCAAFNPGYKILVTNFEQVSKLNPADYDLVIIDEAQNAGAFPKPSQRAVSLRKLCFGKPVIFMSATPSAESYSQLFHQMTISSFSPYEGYMRDPKRGSLYAFYRWARAGYVQITKKRIAAGREVDDYSKCNGDVVWKDVKHLFLQFTQIDAGFIAPVEEHFHHVEMMPETYSLLKEIENDRVHIRRIPISGREIVATVNSGADLLNKMAQISGGTLIFDNEAKGVIFDWSKCSFIKSRFYGRKIAILYRFKAEFEMLKSFFPAYTESPEEFNSRNDLTYLGQIQSSKEGVNLSTADDLICINPDFSATAYFQMKARIQTKERKGSAPFHWVFAMGGIEDKVYKAVSNKKTFTYNYYSRYARKSDTIKNQKVIGETRLDSPATHTSQHIGVS